MIVRIQQNRIGDHDSVAIGVGVDVGGDLIVVLVGDERGYRVWCAAVHPDLAVVVKRHEPPHNVDQRIDDSQVQTIPLRKLDPVVDTGHAEQIDTDPNPSSANRSDVDHLGQVIDITAKIIVARYGL